MRTWDPFSDIEVVRREIDRALASQYGGNGGRAGRSAAAFLPGRAARAYPLINLAEDKDSLYVEALAPGVRPESIDLMVVRNTLTIAGEKAPSAEVPAEKFHRNERAAGKFVRAVDLPSEVDSNGVTARYTDGLLTITLPKAETAKPKQIKLTVG